jgi:hypothetical protein
MVDHAPSLRHGGGAKYTTENYQHKKEDWGIEAAILGAITTPLTRT